MTVPLFSINNVPKPASPTTKRPVLLSSDLLPSTVTAPATSANCAISKPCDGSSEASPAVCTVPWLLILSAPLPWSPTTISADPIHAAPAPDTIASAKLPAVPEIEAVAASASIVPVCSSRADVQCSAVTKCR